MIPQTDPRAGYFAHQQEIDAAMTGVLRGGMYINGREVSEFEKEFGAFHSAEAIGVANGTDALHLAIRACGIGPGDEVITVSHTAVATVAAIELAGASAILVDIDPSTFTIDVRALEDWAARADVGAVKAIIPVHLYGHPADMPAVVTIARRYGWRVIEDCAQSHGAELTGRRTGTWGDIAAFSFYPTKNLGAIGDGGAVVTADQTLAARVRLLREYGWRERYVSEIAGLNSRLDELQAAILRVKLRYLQADNERRRAIASRYATGLADTGLALPVTVDECVHAFHQFVVRHRSRDQVKERLRSAGVGTLVHYPVPVHLQPAYQDRVKIAGALPETEAAAREVLSLPMFPELADDQVEQVIQAVRTNV